MAKTLKTPGVYIQEISAFPNSIVPVPTAVPAFIGYTEKAVGDAQSLTLKPTKIGSFAEYQQLFGGGPQTKFQVATSPDPAVAYTLEITSGYFTLNSQLKLFFANGGNSCYIVSVGGYTKEDGSANTVEASVLKTGIAPLKKETEPTLVVVPELTTIALDRDADGKVAPEDLKALYAVYNEVLDHCGIEMRNRFAILDVRMDPEKHSAAGSAMMRDIDLFRNSLTSEALAFGAAYYPYLDTTILAESDVSILNIEADPLVALLTQDLENSGGSDAFKETLRQVIQEIPTATAEEAQEMTEVLKIGSPLFKAIMTDVRKMLNRLPPSAAMAGIYSLVDSSRGVFQSPANVGVGSVISPAVKIRNDQQEDMNVPLDGKAVNAIRFFPGKGVIVWGARTLDGNSQDWRYISVRRTIIFIEQSIRSALAAYVFEPNTDSTWTKVKASIDNFLNNLWREGGLAGAVPEDSFRVNVGLGSTMTATDILEGQMRISVKVAVARPAEFIEVTFEQQMQQS